MRNVVVLIPALHAGGAERVVVTLLKHFDRSRFRLTLGVVDTRDEVYLAELPPDVELIDFRRRRLRYALPDILRLLWRRRPDVVLSTLGHLNLALALVRPLFPRGVRCVVRETNVVSSIIAGESFAWLRRALYRRFYGRHDLVVCQSADMQADLIRNFGVPRDRTVLVHNPVDVEYVRRLAASPDGVPEQPPGTVTLVAAGRLVEQKGFDLLIRAVALLGDARVRLDLLGDGPLLGRLRDLAVAQGVAEQVRFAGFQRNPYAWYARADAFVLSSRYEGFPNVVLEALACGTPVIACPAPGGVNEILDRVPGCVLAAEIGAEALADAIRAWLAGPRRRVPPTAVEPYAVARIVERYQQVLDR